MATRKSTIFRKLRPFHVYFTTALYFNHKGSMTYIYSTCCSVTRKKLKELIRESNAHFRPNALRTANWPLVAGWLGWDRILPTMASPLKQVLLSPLSYSHKLKMYCLSYWMRIYPLFLVIVYDFKILENRNKLSYVYSLKLNYYNNNINSYKRFFSLKKVKHIIFRYNLVNGS